MNQPADEPTLPPTVMSGPSSGQGGTLTIGERLGNRYTIISLLGRGGMGAVYKAWDDELGVPVAIKTITFDVGTDPGQRGDMERRFKREVQLARQITHKNVVRIHDLGDLDGLKYLTMALVEGETLSALIRRAGPLPVTDVVSFAKQIAEGLVAAHEVGVVHRDLKPENIMVTGDGHACIMDFGIAVSSATHTKSAVIAGTFEYMAPEQSRADAVDGRADIYAFGLIVYDMLTGRRRLKGHDSPMTELMLRLNDAPPPVRSLRPDVPEPLEAIVTRATQPNADARFADAVALQGALAALAPDGYTRIDPSTALVTRARRRSRLALGTLAVVGALLVAGIAWRGSLWSRADPLAAAPPPISVIVANFDNRTGDAIFDGLVEQALSVGIESASFINAFPRSNAVRLAAQYPDKTLSPDTATLIALREGMAAVITGAIEQAPGGYRLPLQVLKPDSGVILFDTVVEARSKEDVLDAVGRLAARVRRGLGDRTADADRVNVDETFTANSLQAAAEYIRGQNLLAEGKPDDALAAYQKAVAIDPALGRAWSGMGAVANNLRRRDEAKVYYDKALEHIERMTERERFRTRGAYYVAMGNAEEAREENEALVARFPSDAAGLANLAVAYFNMWNFPRALELGRQASALYPGNVLRQSNVALFAMYASDFNTATAQADVVLKLNKDYPRAHLVHALAHMAAGRIDQAIERYQVLAKLPAPGSDFAVHGLADAARYRGRLEDAAAVLSNSLASAGAAAARARLLASLAAVRLAQGRASEAITLAGSIKTDGLDTAALMATGEVLAAAGRTKDASAIAQTLVDRVGPDAHAFGSVLQAQMAMAGGEAPEARRLLLAVRKEADAWLVRYWLGRAYLATGMFAEAEDEFATCLRRHGEAAAVFMDDFPTYHRLVDVHYYRGVALDGMKAAGAADSFRTFLAAKDGGDETGGLVADARKRVTGR